MIFRKQNMLTQVARQVAKECGSGTIVAECKAARIFRSGEKLLIVSDKQGEKILIRTKMLEIPDGIDSWESVRCANQKDFQVEVCNNIADINLYLAKPGDKGISFETIKMPQYSVDP